MLALTDGFEKKIAACDGLLAQYGDFLDDSLKKLLRNTRALTRLREKQIRTYYAIAKTAPYPL